MVSTKFVCAHAVRIKLCRLKHLDMANLQAQISSKRKRWKEFFVRKTGIALGIVALSAVIGAAILVATFNVNEYRGTIQSEIEKRLGRPVNLGDMHLKLFPPRFGVQDLAIADDPRFSPDSPFVKAKELDVSVKLLPLLQKHIKIDSLYLIHPTLNHIKH